ncbi:MAG: DUF3592 domain-containing protein [Clostridia bacterium]|nr:DUF3592 domain-containing protein [Clostridia bacterium]
MKRILVLLSGLVVIAAGIFLLAHGNAVKKRCTEPATGVVVENREREDIDEGVISTVYYPVIEFEADGKTVSVTGSSGQNPAKYRIGDQVELLYNPADPSEMLIRGETGVGLFGIIAIVVGVIVSFVGIRIFIRGR